MSEIDLEFFICNTMCLNKENCVDKTECINLFNELLKKTGRMVDEQNKIQ
jgi:hypothetical protein